MSDSLDPYHKWLGISPKDQPPNHYRLLGIDLFEADPDVIASAADQRMAHVRAFQTGKHSAVSQEILNEIAAARVCLLNAERKAAYDRRLRRQLGWEERPPAAVKESSGAVVPGVEILPVPSPGLPVEGRVPPGLEGRFPRPPQYRSRRVSQIVAAIVVTAGLFGAVLAVLFRGGEPDPSAENKPSGEPVIQPHKDHESTPGSNQATSTRRQGAPGDEPEGKPGVEPLARGTEQGAPGDEPEGKPKQGTPPGQSGDPTVTGLSGSPPPEQVPVPHSPAPAAVQGQPGEGSGDGTAGATGFTAIELPSGPVFTDTLVKIPADWHGKMFPDDAQVYVVKYPNDEVRGVYTFQEGKLHGPAASLYESGELRVLASYHMSYRDGPLRVWNEGGQRVLYAEYTRGKKNGLLCLFRDDKPCLIQQWDKARLLGEYLVKWTAEAPTLFPKEKAIAAEDAQELASAEYTLGKLEAEMEEAETELKRELANWYREESLRIRRERAAKLSVLRGQEARARRQAREAAEAAAFRAMWQAALRRSGR